MRCHYLSDLHLETQDFQAVLPAGDILIIAGDLCHAMALDPSRTDRPSTEQRARVLRFVDAAHAQFAHVLMVMGNHDHHGSVFEETAATLRRHLPGVTLLDNEAVDIGGVRFFGTTLWTDFEGRSPACMDAVRKRLSEFYFVRKRPPGGAALRRFQPEDALAAFDASVEALKRCAGSAGQKPVVVISHHAPSRKGLNPWHVGNGLDGAYASDLEGTLAALPGIVAWVHGHTHICRAYRAGGITVRANCRGFARSEASAHTFSPTACFDPIARAPSATAAEARRAGCRRRSGRPAGR